MILHIAENLLLNKSSDRFHWKLAYSLKIKHSYFDDVFALFKLKNLIYNLLKFSLLSVDRSTNEFDLYNPKKYTHSNNIKN